jgi:hypothetical protein
VAASTVVGGVGSLTILWMAVAAVWYGGLPIISFGVLFMYVTATTPHASRGLSAICGDVTKFLAVKTQGQTISGFIGFYLNDYVAEICYFKTLLIWQSFEE